jgi:acylphosphatase
MPPVDPLDQARNLTERVTFRGRVQGVGFRYTSRSIARRYPVAGFVRNLADGSVEVVVQGVRGAVDAFLGDLARAFHDQIRETTREPLTEPELYDSFEIRFA